MSKLTRVTDYLVKVKSRLAGAIERLLEDKLTDIVSVKDFGAKGDGITDDTVPIQTALDTGKKVIFPKGDYILSSELEVTTAGQVICFENSGGYGYGEEIGKKWQPNTRIIAKGSFLRKIRTRRNFRASRLDPQDEPLSVVLNIQAEGVILDKVCVWLQCDYTDNSPDNLGSDVDVGIFVGTRVGVQMRDIQVIGYYRKAGVMYDVSGASNLPRFKNSKGVRFPSGTVLNGSDGCHMINPYIRGGRVGLAILGAKPKTGATGYTDPYYDEEVGLVQDLRGSFGASDFAVFGGRIYGPDHHSNRRLKDPELNTSGLLDVSSLTAEPEFAPAAVWIDGLAGNASGNLWGLRFFGTRIATFEALRVRLGHASRVMFSGVHIEGRDGGRMSSTGQLINTNDYTKTSYGDVTGLSYTDRVLWVGSVRQTLSNGAAPHFYGSAFMIITDSGRIFFDGYVQAKTGEVDIRGSGVKSGGANNGLRVRNSDKSLWFVDSSQASPVSDSTMSLGSRGARYSKVYGEHMHYGDGVSFLSSGNGSPEGVVTASIGSLYTDRSGSAGTVLYVKESGSGNTGWVAK